MFDIGMTELLVIGIVALIVVGPKDLPGMFRTLGRFTGKMKSMAREFQRAMDDAADEAGVKTISKDLKGLSNPKRYGLDKLNEAADSFEKWQPGRSASPKGRDASPLSPERAAKADTIRKSAADTAQARLDAAAEPQDGPSKATGTAGQSPITAPERDT